jgi:hypothetical protein
LKTLYNIIRSFGLIWITQASCGHRAFEKNRGYPEEALEIRVTYTGMETRYRTTSVPPYSQRCRMIDLDVLSSRRRVLCALFISDVYSCKLDCPIILSSLRLNVYLYNTR